MDALHLGRELAHVGGQRGVSRRLRGARRAGCADDQHRDCRKYASHSAFALSSATTQSAHASECSARSMPRRRRK